ncbi:MAG TPA: hypothetical protein VGO41_02520 [Steroidobacteraceae bacterium]|jgi:hypothetical protein|nr:hypothetical protein [Steroidobacteraceae bacterium]
MSQQNPIKLFVTHVWEEGDDYLRVFEFLESARNFYYRNSGTPDKPPTGDNEVARDDLRRQMDPAEIVIALSSLYTQHPDMLVFQLNYAKAMNKPVLVVKLFGVQAPVPKIVADRADDIVDWDERGLVDAIRLLARHENTARYDTIEFKLDD